MNKVEHRVLEWLLENNISYEKTSYGFSTPLFNIKCVTLDQNIPFYKEPNDRIVGEWELENHIIRLNDWVNKRPTLRIEKMNIVTSVTPDSIMISGYSKSMNELVAESEFYIEPDNIYWADTRYDKYHVPGWLSKTLKTVLRLELNLPIETVTNAINGSYHRIGFKVIEQVDVRYFLGRMRNPKKNPFTYPENIVMWRLRYDNISAI